MRVGRVHCTKFLPAEAELKPVAEKGLLGGVTVLKGFAGVAAQQDWNNRLYQPSPATRRVELTAIPYYAWDNREAGAMKVWLPVGPVAAGIDGEHGKK